MPPLQQDEKNRQKKKSVYEGNNKDIENSIDFHSKIVKKIDNLLKNHEEKIKSNETENNQQSNIIQEETFVEIREPLNKNIEPSNFYTYQNQDSFFYKHITIPEEFKTEIHTFHSPSFKFVSELESKSEITNFKKQEDKYIEIIDLASLAKESGAIKNKIEVHSISNSDDNIHKYNKIDIINIDKMDGENIQVCSASSNKSDTKSEKGNIYYLKSKEDYDDNNEKSEKDQSYIPVDLSYKQIKLKEKEEQELKKQKESQGKKNKKEEKKQLKEEKKRKKLEEKLQKKEEKKALIEKLKREAEEKKRLKKQSKKPNKKGKTDNDFVQFVESKSEEKKADDEVKNAFETNIAEPFEDYNDENKYDNKITTNPDENRTVNQAYTKQPTEISANKNPTQTIDINQKEKTIDDDHTTSSTQPSDIKENNNIKNFYQSDIKETKISENIKKIQKSKPEDAVVDEDVIKVLLIADNLLGNLPEEVINNFVKSDNFKLYEKVIRKYKNK